ncbi:hypothetical protein NUW54_g5833 [Trametes sanguinea]|uniref:Uncharacterized protein n=1 Tax=Trametes sanguinea TaxID=158606 RepID=A0ACC1PU24_9APHY|nr:hypothetical protein NUW54_g5833 [Trametes sanguinea]
MKTGYVGSRAGRVTACSRTGLTPATEGTPNKLRDGIRSHDGIEGIPTDQPLECAEVLVDGEGDERMSALEPETEGG